jgi:phage/plasmid-associated DNA primase
MRNQRYLMANSLVTYNSNGKSTTLELVKETLGDYYAYYPTGILTVKRKSSSNATPELADKRGKRCLIIQEPEHDDTIYVGQMKNLTGADWIEARALYGDPFTYKPQFKLILICNKLPFIPANDDGTWRRLRVTPWEVNS